MCCSNKLWHLKAVWLLLLEVGGCVWPLLQEQLCYYRAGMMLGCSRRMHFWLSCFLSGIEYIPRRSPNTWLSLSV